jgi:hypothetical protein
MAQALCQWHVNRQHKNTTEIVGVNDRQTLYGVGVSLARHVLPVTVRDERQAQVTTFSLADALQLGARS